MYVRTHACYAHAKHTHLHALFSTLPFCHDLEAQKPYQIRLGAFVMHLQPERPLLRVKKSAPFRRRVHQHSTRFREGLIAMVDL